MKKILLIVLIAGLAIGCLQKSELDKVDTKSKRNEAKYGGDTTKVLDSFYIVNCVLYHKLKWEVRISETLVTTYDTIIARGNPCITITLPVGGLVKIKDTCYIKYCETYCEKTWLNFSVIPGILRDTIYISGCCYCGLLINKNMFILKGRKGNSIFMGTKEEKSLIERMQVCMSSPPLKEYWTPNNDGSISVEFKRDLEARCKQCGKLFKDH